MIVLDIFRTSNDILELSRWEQRAGLEDRGIDVVPLDLTGLPVAEAQDRYIRAMDMARPQLQLIRGGDVLEILPLVTKVPTLFDHSTPYSFGKTTPLRGKLEYLRRSFCYSTMAVNDLKDAMVHRITLVSGPYLSPIPTPEPEKMTVAVLKTCSLAQQVLREVAHMRDRAHLDFNIVSTMPAPGVEVVESSFEAARRASLVCAPMEDIDYGQPHVGAVLALATGKALATSRTSALESLPYPTGSFISILKHAPRSYGTAATTLANSKGLSDWPKKVQYDAEKAIDVLAEHIRQEALNG